jgi:DNA repair ATPase RecN
MVRVFISLVILLLGSIPSVFGQADEIAQLLLNVEKLSQLKSILSDLKKSYNILNGGYSAIKNISQGNFDLHKAFLDGLMEANPVVKKYYKVNDIIAMQIQLIKEYKSSYQKFCNSGRFTSSQMDYIKAVYANLIKLSLQNLDELSMIVTGGKLRMSDDERLVAIDRIHSDMEDKLLFLSSFNNDVSILGIQRKKAKDNIAATINLYGLGQ